LHTFEDARDLVDVVDVTKDNFTITVVFCVLKSSFLQFIGLGIIVGPRIINDNPRVMYNALGIISRLSNILYHGFILSRPLIKNSIHTLGAPPDATAILLVIIAEGRHSILGPEFGTRDQIFLRHGLGHDEQLRVCRANLKLRVIKDLEGASLIFKVDALSFGLQSDVLIEAPTVLVIHPVAIVDVDLELEWECPFEVLPHHLPIVVEITLLFN
jgi:hypothetical protein